VTVSIPAFRAASCVRYRFRYSECQRCFDACPHDAVALSDEGVRIALERCQNCGLCTSACRTAALVSGNLPRVELLKQAIKQTQFGFACAPSGSAGDATVPCLGAIDAAMLAYLAKRGIKVELHGSHHCAACPHGAKGAAQLALNLEGAETLRQAAPGESWVPARLVRTDESRVEKPASDFRPGRRQLFRRLVGRGIDEIARGGAPAPDSPAPEQAIRAGPYALTEMRELLQIVCKPKTGSGCVVRPHPALPMMGLRLAPGCTGCEACFRACPTGALKIAETDTAWALTFEPDRCVACEVCVEVCQPGVLRAAAKLDAAPRRGDVTLYRLGKQRCTRCDRSFVSPEPRETCAVCTDDEEAFNVIFG
jgi:formate hydrogenlyase subunit 6/NADH:ubiquinone oxidoreductase subunit I